MESATLYVAPDALGVGASSEDAPSLSLHSVVLVRFPAEPDDRSLLHGIVLGSGQDWARVRVDGAVKLSGNPQVELLCTAASGGSDQRDAIIVGVAGPSACPTLDLRLGGSPQRVHPRQTYRAAVACLGLDADIVGMGMARVLDVSAEGMAVLSRHSLQRGAEVIAKLEFAGQCLMGTLIARHVVSRDCGRFRIGLEAADGNDTLRRSLREMTMLVQREQLRRLALLRTEGPLSAVLHTASTSRAPADAGAPVAVINPACDGEFDERRIHARLPWKSRLTLELDEGGPVRRLSVETIDIACGGFSCFSRAYVHAGATVAATLPVRSNGTRVKGVLRYCHVAEGAGHRCGIQFTEVDVSAAA